MYAARVDPAIVEVKKRAGSNGEVNRFVIPAHCSKRRHVFRSNPRGIVIDLIDETEQRFVLFVQRGGLQIAQHALHEFFAAQQFRRNCGVGF